MKGLIYAILIDEKFYIGATTTSIEKRMISHKSLSRNPCKKNSKLYKYIEEIENWDDILYIILETVEYKTLRELENVEYNYIKLHINDSNCLNIMQNVKQKYIIDKYKRKFMTS